MKTAFEILLELLNKRSLLLLGSLSHQLGSSCLRMSNRVDRKNQGKRGINFENFCAPRSSHAWKGRSTPRDFNYMTQECLWGLSKLKSELFLTTNRILAQHIRQEIMTNTKLIEWLNTKLDLTSRQSSVNVDCYQYKESVPGEGSIWGGHWIAGGIWIAWVKACSWKRELDHTIRLTVQEPSEIVAAVVGESEKGLERQANIWQKIMHTLGSHWGF